MQENIRVSVAMATYNGEKFIKEQLESVLANLGPSDEVVISDDGSADSTKAIVSAFNDSRIRLLEGPGKGIKKNFENAIKACLGKYIFLCDQDDIWEKEKVNIVLAAFEKYECPVVVHDCIVTDSEGKVLEDSFFRFKKSGAGVLKNIIKNTYIGCCMAFDSDILKKIILPIPDNIVMHDQWIGVFGDYFGGSVFISDKLIKYRRHGENSSEIDRHFGFATMVRNRIRFIKELSKRRKLINRQTI